MDQRAAFSETVSLISNRAPGNDPLFLHIVGMEPRMEEWFSEAKLGRWLGWAQGVACAMNWMSLNEAKQINKKYSNGT